MLNKALLFIPVMAFIVSAGCESQEPGSQQPFVVESKASPSSPIYVKLTTTAFTEPPKLGSEENLILEVRVEKSYDNTLPNSIANIDLPKGVELISGDTQWTGNLSNDKPVTLSAKVKFAEEGNWSISASAKSYFTEDSWYGNAADICYSVSKDAIAQQAGKCTTTTHLPPGMQETLPSLDECSSDADCATAGCSGQICTAAEDAGNTLTTCEYREEFRCLAKTSCGCMQGKCGWAETPEYEKCIESFS